MGMWAKLSNLEEHVLSKRVNSTHNLLMTFLMSKPKIIQIPHDVVCLMYRDFCQVLMKLIN